jgi:hypothetical protein
MCVCAANYVIATQAAAGVAAAVTAGLIEEVAAVTVQGNALSSVTLLIVTMTQITAAASCVIHMHAYYC